MRRLSANQLALAVPRRTRLHAVVKVASLLIATLLFFAARHCAEGQARAPLGMVWNIRGNWTVEGASSPLGDGTAIEPGSLLEAVQAPGNHTVKVLLADGQLIYAACFTVEDCSRGFRVPELSRAPDPFAVELLTGIRAGLGELRREQPDAPDTPREQLLPRDEVLTAFEPSQRAQIGGLASRLPNGSYSCDLRPLDSSLSRQPHLTVVKSSSLIELPLPAPGLYDLIITDSLNRPRINVFLAAASPEQAGGMTKAFNEARALLKRWNLAYAGWPVHDFQRAYLEALFHGDRPAAGDRRFAALASLVKGAKLAPTRTTAAEPAFTPRAGALDGNCAIKLESATPGATIHFTVDSSQPSADSPVYTAPVIVKGSGLTIKAFAAAPGKKDSAVVTADYRIRHEEPAGAGR